MTIPSTRSVLLKPSLQFLILAQLRVIAFALLCALSVAVQAQSSVQVEQLELGAEALSAEKFAVLAKALPESKQVNPTHMKVKRGEPRLWRVRVLALEKEPAQLVLSINNSFDRDVRFFFPPNYAPQTHNLFDSTTPSEHSRFALAVRLPSDIKVGDVFFVEIPKPTAAALELRIRDRVSYARHDTNLVRIHSSVVSVMLCCCAVALCFFFILRERVWLFFVAYAIAATGYVLSRTGEIIAIFGGVSFDSAVWQASIILAMLHSGALFFFVCEFAKLKQTTPLGYKLMRALGWIALLLVGLSFMPAVAASSWLAAAVNSVALVSGPISVLSCIASGRQGVRAAWFYLIAFCPLIATFILTVAYMQGKMAGGDWVTVAFLSGHAFAAITLTLGMADQVLSYRQQRDEAEDKVNHDPLTGAFSRRAFDQKLGELLNQQRSSDPVTVCFLDIDYFKQVNDQFGHAVGDEALRFLVQQAEKELRGEHFISRIGGEEFVVVLPNTQLHAGLAIAEHIRQRIEVQGKQLFGHPLNLTVSIGVMTSTDQLHSPQALIAAADSAVYLAKSKGRNRVETMAIKLEEQSA